MRSTYATGLVFKGIIPKKTAITVRTETTGDFSTLSLADDDGNIMIQVVVTPEVKKVLKGVCK